MFGRCAGATYLLIDTDVLIWLLRGAQLVEGSRCRKSTHFGLSQTSGRVVLMVPAGPGVLRIHL